MRRIAIIGCGGAENSTFFWDLGWVPTPNNQWVNIQEELAFAYLE